MINAFLPSERVYIPELDKTGVVTAVRISSFGTEYLIRYAADGVFSETWVYDFEIKPIQKVNQ